MSLTVALYSNPKLRRHGTASMALKRGVEDELSVNASDATTVRIERESFISCSFLTRSSSSKAVLEEYVHAVVESAPKSFVGGQPAQVVGADQEVSARRYAVGKVEGAIPRPASVGNILVDRIVGGKA